MDLAQRLAVQKLLSERLAAVRTETLLPEAQATLVPGERHAAKFGPAGAEQVAAMVTMPEPSKRAAVTEPAKLLAWAKENAPHQVQVAEEVIVCDALIDYLTEHAPQFLRQSERVDPQWVDDSLKGLKERGRIADHNGEVHTEVPGITVGYGDSVPRVILKPDAAVIIGKAWRDGKISVPSLLALPSGEGA